MPTQLYATLLRQTQQLRPGERRTRVRTWTWLLAGLYLSRCVHLSRIAAKIPGVLYQQPCFCHCDRHFGHDSLRGCFTDEHGSQCSTCMAEAFYAYQMTKKGATPKQIRAGIMKGDYQSIDLQKVGSIE